MPLALEPGETFRVVLEADRAKPEPRPVFLVRHLSARQWRRLDEVLSTLETSASGGEALGRVLDALRPHVAGWQHLVGPDGAAVPFDPGELDAVLALPEVYELAYAVLAGGRLETDEKKGLRSPSPSGGDSSAPGAAAGPPEGQAPDATDPAG